MAVVGCGDKCPGTLVWTPEEGIRDKVGLFCQTVRDSISKKHTPLGMADLETDPSLQRLVLMNLDYTSILVQFRDGASISANRWNWHWLGKGGLVDDAYHRLIMWERGKDHFQVAENDASNPKLELSRDQDAQVQTITLICLSCIQKAVVRLFFTQDCLVFSQAQGVSSPVTTIGEYIMGENDRPTILAKVRYYQKKKNAENHLDSEED
jgi:hypothetical protein